MDKILLRLKNPVFVFALVALIVAVLVDFGVTDAPQYADRYMKIIEAILIALGIWTNPTTPGIKD